jgi:hypothetical protein
MTPEERQLVVDLFDRLAELEREKRDPDAERLIREGLARAPNAVYSLVQTTLLQDEGLRAADEHIAQLEEELAQAQSQGKPQGSFLGDRRSKWNTGEVIGGGAPQGGGGSVPQVGGRDQPMGAPGSFGDPRYGGPQYGDPRGGPQYGGPPAGEPPRSGGGGFLGTAAAVAAGAIGGGLLMNGIRSAMGGHGDQKGPMAGAFDQLTGGKSSSGGGDLARDAGLGDIGASRSRGFNPDQSKKDEDTESSDDGDEDLEDEDLDHEDMQDGYNDDE